MLKIKENASKEEQATVEYMNEIYEKVKARDPHEEEFLQATKMLFDSLIPVFVKNRTYKEHNILERIIESERVIIFCVPWIDDFREVEIKRGYRVEYNSVIRTYLGGFRLYKCDYLSVIKII